MTGEDRDLLDQRGENLVLALEIIIERRTTDAERIGDVLQVGAAKAALGEQLGGRFQHRLPQRFLLGFSQRAWRLGFGGWCSWHS